MNVSDFLPDTDLREAITAFFSEHYEVLKDFAGPSIAIIIAYFGFKSFRRWKRGQLEERRMEVAFRALKLAYQSTFVFENIRSPLVESYEWADMPQRPGEDESKWHLRGTYYAILKRIERNQEFFKAVWEVQPACMAMFGVKIEDTFLELHKARKGIEVACQMLHSHINDVPMIPDPNKALWEQLRADIYAGLGEFAPEGDRVGKRLVTFKGGIDKVCLPVIKRGISGRFYKWF